MADEPDAPEPITTTREGVAMHGEFPLNHRLRAEALAKANKTTDPDELIPDDLIASTKERLDAVQAEQAAEAERIAKERPVVKESMSREKLVDIAEREGAAFETDANKPTIVAAIEANRLTNTEA